MKIALMTTKDMMKIYNTKCSIKIGSPKNLKDLEYTFTIQNVLLKFLY